MQSKKEGKILIHPTEKPFIACFQSTRSPQKGETYLKGEKAKAEKYEGRNKLGVKATSSKEEGRKLDTKTGKDASRLR